LGHVQTPIDLRDIIQVPPGKLAPWGYVEYLPGWFAPGPNSPIPDDFPAARQQNSTAMAACRHGRTGTAANFGAGTPCQPVIFPEDHFVVSSRD
jgi:hypothetical protein